MGRSLSHYDATSLIPTGFGEALAGLTEHQYTIARLVGSGHTNRETAELLGLSAKTVEWNLSRIYRALGVRSRTELAAALPRADALHPGCKSGETPGRSMSR